MAYAAFRSIGAYVPSKILTNDDLSKMVDTTDEWITKRTGIKERRIAAKDETTSDLGVKAAKLAIERSGIDASEIDMLICATISPDYFCMPSTATIIATKLGLGTATAFDISAACTGFVYILSIAKAFIESGMKKIFLSLELKNYQPLLIIQIVELVFYLEMEQGQLLFLLQKSKKRELWMYIPVLMVRMQIYS